MKVKYFKLIIVFIFLSILNTTKAEVLAKTDKNNYQQAENIILKVITNEGETIDLSSSLNKDFIITSHSSSNQYSLVNGVASNQISWVLSLKAKRTGSLTIPSFQFPSGSKTKPIDIEIKETKPNTVKDNYYFEISMNKKDLFIQEETLVTMRFFYRLGFGIQVAKLAIPEGENFILRPAEGDYRGDRVKKKGKSFHVIERVYTVSFNNSGEQVLGDFLFEGFENYLAISTISEPIKLNIKPVESSFTNNNWIPAKTISLTQELNKQNKYKVGEPIERIITFNVLGLSENKIPKLSFPDIKNAKSYEDEVTNNSTIVNNSSFAERKMKYIIIPEKSGELIIPEFKLKWFNTQTNKEETIVLNQQVLSIEPSQIAPTNSPLPTTSTATNKTPQTQELKIDEKSNFWKKMSIALAIFTVIFVLIILFILNKYKKLKNDSQTVNFKQEIVKEVLDNKSIFKQLDLNSNKDTEVALISYWNSNNSTQIRTLSQLTKLISDQETIDNLQKLEAIIYKNQNTNLENNWKEIIKQGKLNPKSGTQKDNSKLPELF